MCVCVRVCAWLQKRPHRFLGQKIKRRFSLFSLFTKKGWLLVLYKSYFAINFSFLLSPLDLAVIFSFLFFSFLFGNRIRGEMSDRLRKLCFLLAHVYTSYKIMYDLFLSNYNLIHIFYNNNVDVFPKISLNQKKEKSEILRKQQASLR